jgi:hypothetical protein
MRVHTNWVIDLTPSVRVAGRGFPPGCGGIIRVCGAFRCHCGTILLRRNKPLTDDERKWFRQIVQRIAALLALGADLNALYQEAVTDAFTATELGIAR